MPGETTEQPLETINSLPQLLVATLSGQATMPPLFGGEVGREDFFFDEETVFIKSSQAVRNNSELLARSVPPWLLSSLSPFVTDWEENK